MAAPMYFRSGTSLRKPSLAERAGIPISAEEIGSRIFARSAPCRYPNGFCPTTSTGQRAQHLWGRLLQFLQSTGQHSDGADPDCAVELRDFFFIDPPTTE